MRSRALREDIRVMSRDGLLARTWSAGLLRRPSHAPGVPKADVSPQGGTKKIRQRREDRVRAVACPAAHAKGAQKNPLKKAISAPVAAKKQLRRRAHVLFSAAIRNCAAAQQRARSNIRGVAQYGEKG
jgi:hypothetical protein